MKGLKMTGSKGWIAAGLIVASMGGTAASAQQDRDWHRSGTSGREANYRGQDYGSRGRAYNDHRSHYIGRDGRPRCNHYKLEHHVPCFR